MAWTWPELLAYFAAPAGALAFGVALCLLFGTWGEE